MSKHTFKITTRITDKKESSIDTYLNEVSKIPMFANSQEEYDCAVLAVRGDKKAKDMLITRNLRFVISVAKSYQNGNTMLADLINEGNLGLIQAAETYDPSRGNKFYSYAVFHIRRNIIDFITDHGMTVRLPSNKVALVNKVKKHLSQLEQKTGVAMDVMDLIRVNDNKFTEGELMSVIGLINGSVTSLDEPIEYQDGTDNRHEHIEENTFGWADTDMMSTQSKEIMMRRFSKLRPVEQAILIHRFGLNGHVEKTLKECGELPEINLSNEGVRLIESIALNKLRRGECLI